MRVIESLKIDLSPHINFNKLDICDASKLEQIFEQFQPDAIMHQLLVHVEQFIKMKTDTFIQANIVDIHLI